MRIINYVQINPYTYYNTPQKMYVTIEHSVVRRYQDETRYAKLCICNYGGRMEHSIESVIFTLTVGF